jgi:hypothetical protein
MSDDNVAQFPNAEDRFWDEVRAGLHLIAFRLASPLPASAYDWAIDHVQETLAQSGWKNVPVAANSPEHIKEIRDDYSKVMIAMVTIALDLWVEQN